MPQKRKELPLSTNIWLRLKMLENWNMPMWMRQVAVASFFSSDDIYKRYKTIGSREVVFLHVPKTAGSSISASFDVLRGHIPVSRFIALDRERFEASFSFTFVRNPWDRLHSAYKYLKSSVGKAQSKDVLWAADNLAEYQDFEEFVLSLKSPSVWRRIHRSGHFQEQANWLCLPGDDQIQVDFVGRFEVLQEDVERLAGIIGANNPLPHRRRSKTKTGNAFTPEMVSIVADRYSRDVNALGYDGPS